METGYLRMPCFFVHFLFKRKQEANGMFLHMINMKHGKIFVTKKFALLSVLHYN